MAPIRTITKKHTSGKGQNQWTTDQRLTLHLLHVRFHLTITQRTAIFNAIYAEQLRRCGIPDGLSKAPITAQYAMRLRLTGNADWRTICAEAMTAEEVARRDLLTEQIAKMAENLGIRATRTASARVATLPTPREGGDPLQGTPLAHFPGSQAQSRAINELTHSEAEGAGNNTLTPPPTQPKRMVAQQLERDLDDLQLDDLVAQSDLEGDVVSQPSPTLAKRARLGAQVIVPLTPTSERACYEEVPETPSKSRLRIEERRANAIHEYARPAGNLMLNDRMFAMTQEPLVEPTYAEAHPPLAGLLYRYWTDESQSKLDDNGEFVAGRFAMFPLPIPTVVNPVYPEWWHDVGAHMNRNQVPTPFISTCNDLTWILRLAVGEAKEGVPSGRISVIDAGEINTSNIFHAQVFHRQLSKKAIFDDVAWLYAGKREFLVHGKIPSAAVKHTFTVAQLMQLTTRSPPVGELLRLNQLCEKRKGLAATIQKAFKKQKVPLDRKAILAMAEIARFLGLSSASATEHVMHVVSDLTQGWNLAVSYQSAQTWTEDAARFASAMHHGPHGSLEDFQRMKLAFLEGVRWSRGSDTSTRHNVNEMRLMLLRAKKIGLEDISKTLCDELDSAKLRLKLFDENQQRLLKGSAVQRLLLGESGPTTPRTTRRYYGEDIAYYTDDNDD